MNDSLPGVIPKRDSVGYSVPPAFYLVLNIGENSSKNIHFIASIRTLPNSLRIRCMSWRGVRIMKVYLYQHPLKVFIEIFYLLDRRSILILVLVSPIVCLFIPEHRSSDFIAEHHQRGCQIQGAYSGHDLYVKWQSCSSSLLSPESSLPNTTPPEQTDSP